MRYEKFLAKVKDENPEHLEADEQVEEAIPGQTGGLHTSPLSATVDIVRRLTGQLQSRLMILTDRNLYVAHTGAMASWKIKEVKARYPRSEAGAHLRAYARGGLVDVDGERIHFAIRDAKHARALVNAAGGGGAEPAA